jgi:nicotinate-nucleotide adenylyltransferase
MDESGAPSLDATRRIGFFGGSFDPPHFGHLAVAWAAQAALGLDAVLFAPVGAQPLKPFGSTASFEQRLAMTELAIAGDSSFSVSLADAPKANGAPNYTWGTLQAVRNELPAESELFFLMGADSLAGFRRWFRAEEIPFVASLVVASRPGEEIADLKALFPSGLIIEAAPNPTISGSTGMVRAYGLRRPGGDRATFYLLPDVEVEISASQIREQIQDPGWSSEEAKNHLPFPVLEYIRNNKLYL